MTSLTASLKRYTRLMLALAIAGVAALAMMVATAPAAHAGYQPKCFLSTYHPERGDFVGAHCVHFTPNHKGVVYTVQRQFHNRKHRHHHKHCHRVRHHWRCLYYRTYVLGHFRTNGFGSATFQFHVKPRLHYGKHRINFRVGLQETHRIIYIRHRHH